MIPDFAIIRDLPEKARKPYRRFLVVYGFTVVFLAIVFTVIYYESIVDPSVVGEAGVCAALVGLVMTTMLGGAGVRCIRDLARAPNPVGADPRLGNQHTGSRE